MFKQFLTGSSFFAFLLVSSLSAHAQAPKPTQSVQPQAPAATQTKISSEELQKFARTIKQLIAIEQGANQQMGEVLSKSGLPQERFVEIHKSQRDPSAKPATAISPDEKKKYENAIASLRQIQQKAEVNMQNVLQKEGLKLERFNQIEAVVRQDPTLQQKVRDLIRG